MRATLFSETTEGQGGEYELFGVAAFHHIYIYGVMRTVGLLLI